MKQYVKLIKRILAEGEVRNDRTGVGTLSIFGGEIAFDLRQRFPLVTIKKTLYEKAFIEMLWFISGETNIKYLKDRNVSIWDEWADENGNLGPVYGHQWRFWPGKLHEVLLSDVIKTAESGYSNPIVKHELLVGEKSSGHPNYDTVCIYQEKVDQLRNLISMMRTNPTGRRHIVSAWNPGFIDKMGLPPCHYLFQTYVSNDRHMDLRLNIRSWDTALGAPFNIAQYALLTHLLARAAGLTPRFLQISYGDAHLYLNHVEEMKRVVETLEPVDCQPKLIINTDNVDIDGYKPEDFSIEGYISNQFVKLPVAV